MGDEPANIKEVKALIEWVRALGYAILIFLLIRTFVMKTLEVSGPSMEPTFVHGDRAIVDLLSYRFGEPAYNDVIAFHYKGDPTKNFLKRIVGKPGDTIDLVGGQFLLNGTPLTDAFSSQIVTSVGDTQFPLVVPEDAYFVLGDNRHVSKDSRYQSVGCVSEKEMIGKVSVIVWPFNKIRFVE